MNDIPLTHGKLTRYQPRVQPRDVMEHGKEEKNNDLFYKNEKGQYMPLINRSHGAATRDNKIIGIIIDKYVRPIYNRNHKMVMLRENDRKQIQVSLEYAERLGVNTPAKYI